MKEIQRFEILDYGFGPFRSINDPRLQVEGDVFNDFFYGSGFSRRSALMNVVSTLEENGFKVPKALRDAEMKASMTEQADDTFQLAVRFFYDRSKEDAQFEANLNSIIEADRAKRQALIDSGELVEDDQMAFA